MYLVFAALWAAGIAEEGVAVPARVRLTCRGGLVSSPREGLR